jgi:uncharacterized protein (DUF3820 family)
MNTFKRLNSKTVRLSHGELVEIYKGVMIGDIPNEYNHWFNYRGLTYIIS